MNESNVCVRHMCAKPCVQCQGLPYTGGEARETEQLQTQVNSLQAKVTELQGQLSLAGAGVGVVLATNLSDYDLQLHDFAMRLPLPLSEVDKWTKQPDQERIDKWAKLRWRMAQAMMDNKPQPKEQ